jgi:OOP family OmpA-OmpF porin
LLVIAATSCASAPPTTASPSEPPPVTRDGADVALPPPPSATVDTAESTPAPVAPPKRRKDVPELQLPRAIPFVTGKADLRPESDELLMMVKSFLDAHPEVTLLRIESHSDNRGSSQFNLELTRLRAFAIAQWLVAHGIECSRLVPVGFGETRPIIDERAGATRERSRRIEFHNAAIDGALTGPIDGGGSVAGDACNAH